MLIYLKKLFYSGALLCLLSGDTTRVERRKFIDLIRDSPPWQRGKILDSSAKIAGLVPAEVQINI